MPEETARKDACPHPEASARGRRWRYLPALVIAAGLAIGYAMGWQHYLSLHYLAQSRETLRSYVDMHPVLAPSGFAVLYALAVAFSFPAASVLTIFGGFLFGWLLGGMIVALAATVGATTVFLAARSALGDFLTRKVGRRAGELSKGFRDDAFGYLLILRLAPVVPFFILNIVPALFDVPVRTYVAATFLGILPGTFAYAYLGTGVESVLVAAAEGGQDVSASDLVTPQITTAFVVLTLAATIPLLIKKFMLGRR